MRYKRQLRAQQKPNPKTTPELPSTGHRWSMYFFSWDSQQGNVHTSQGPSGGRPAAHKVIYWSKTEVALQGSLVFLPPSNRRQQFHGHPTKLGMFSLEAQSLQKNSASFLPPLTYISYLSRASPTITTHHPPNTTKPLPPLSKLFCSWPDLSWHKWAQKSAEPHGLKGADQPA